MKIELQGMNGMPDRIALLPNGKYAFVELKRPGGKPRKLQHYVHEKLRRKGFRVEVVDNFESGKKLLDELLGEKHDD